MKKTFYLVIFLLLSVSVFTQQHTADNTLPDSLAIATTRSSLNSLPADRYLKREFHAGADTLRYRFLLPEKIKKNKKYPLIITLHNSSRIGNDNERQLEPMARIWLREDVRSKYPAYVIAPQFAKRSSNYEMDSSRNILVSKPSDDVYLLVQLVRQLRNEIKDIDPKRVYIVGYSMGGSTGQSLLTIAPETFAALVSIAAVPDFSGLEKINKKPIWLIHGKKDTENPYEGSVQLFKEMRRSRRIVFTTYSELDHNNISISLLLADKIPAWLFKQHD